MTEKFISWNPTGKSMRLLGLVNQVLAEYEALGYRLTLRQLYYQLVSRVAIPNTLRSYSSLGDLVSKGRLAGLIDWEMIENRVRVPRSNTHWRDEAQILQAAADGFYLSRWEGQANHVELWCEKDAVSNILEPVCRELDVLFLANRGYGSQTALYDAAKRFAMAMKAGKECWLLYFGDHDPLGLDMSRDIEYRLSLFHEGAPGLPMRVKRVALTMAQVEEYGPPENPAKQEDSRYRAYAEQFGESSWELDALEPGVLAELARTEICDLLDPDGWARVERKEVRGKKRIRALIGALK
jgi:hypothetical protein